MTLNLDPGSGLDLDPGLVPGIAPLGTHPAAPPRVHPPSHAGSVPLPAVRAVLRNQSWGSNPSLNSLERRISGTLDI